MSDNAMETVDYRCATGQHAVQAVPLHAVWINPLDTEMDDAVKVRCTKTAFRFSTAALEIGLVSDADIRRGRVNVTVDRGLDFLEDKQ